MDMGGAYVGPQQGKIIAVMKELGLELYQIPEGGDSIIEVQVTDIQ